MEFIIIKIVEMIRKEYLFAFHLLYRVCDNLNQREIGHLSLNQILLLLLLFILK